MINTPYGNLFLIYRGYVAVYEAGGKFSIPVRCAPCAIFIENGVMYLVLPIIILLN